jgi:hypothetical protein
MMNSSVLRGTLAIAGLCVIAYVVSSPPTADPASGLFTLAILGALYFVPAMTAYRRDHANKAAIAALNICLGWTGVGWVAALVWSLTDNTNKTKTMNV